MAGRTRPLSVISSCIQSLSDSPSFPAGLHSARSPSHRVQQPFRLPEVVQTGRTWHDGITSLESSIRVCSLSARTNRHSAASCSLSLPHANGLEVCPGLVQIVSCIVHCFGISRVLESALLPFVLGPSHLTQSSHHGQRSTQVPVRPSHLREWRDANQVPACIESRRRVRRKKTQGGLRLIS